YMYVCMYICIFVQIKLNKIRRGGSLRQCQRLWLVLGWGGAFAKKKSWSDALNYCRLYHTDSATIENQDENTALKLLLNDQNVDAAYMGLYRDRWKWSDQSSSVFRAWKSSEPNNFNGTEFCAQLPVLTAQWNDISCSVKLRYKYAAHLHLM
uniref:C-type lectin domain-containing protein n=1 Tax=Cyprinus carpio TaxID=7962 RepID=A0A8C1GIW5_CYPCA